MLSRVEALRIRGAASFVVTILLGIACLTSAHAREGYMRFPDIHADTIVFTAEGDLWTVSAAGGEARRVTSHPGSELMASFSPDGRWIAFAGDYDGNRDVYVVPATGGEPRRLTWNGGPDEPLCWFPDGKRIAFRSIREHPHFNYEAYAVPIEGGEPEKLPIGNVVQFGIDASSGRYAFTRIGGGGTWKRYRGGSADDIWVGDPRAGSYTAVTSFAGMDNSPMWHGGMLYFVSDQGGTANLWSMNPDGSGRRRLTDLGNWDARFAAIDDSPGGRGRIVFTAGGNVQLFDPASGTLEQVAVEIPSERYLTRDRFPHPGEFMTGYSLAPEGDRLAVVARGELFSVAAKHGVTLPITNGSAAREGRMNYDAKGEKLVYVTDDEGEESIVVKDAWGRGEAQRIVKGGRHGVVFTPIFSPDGKWIAYADQTQSLFIVSAAGGEEPRKVDSCRQWEITQYSWSPDGRWLAYAKIGDNDYPAIFLYDTKDAKIHQVTGWTTRDHSPAWDPKGRYLYFLSDRTVNPWIEWDRDFETINPEPTRPYAVLLRPDVDNPVAQTKGLPPKDGDKKGDKEKDKKKDKDGDKADGGEDEKIEPVEIVIEGLADRVVELPVEAGRYFGLGATEGKVFYLSFPNRGIADMSPVGDDEPQGGSLIAYDLEKREAKPFMQGVLSYDLQAKSGKIAVDKGRGEIYIVDAGTPPGDDLSESKVSLDQMVIELNPGEEWRQMYFEGWRWMRDYFWDANMHGVDWNAIRDQYATLLPRVATRDELQDLLAEMIGELSNSHTYVWGGDRGAPPAPQVSTGCLGAVLRREGSAFRVERIYRGDPADRVRSPLVEPPADVKEGEYILAVNHRGLRADEPLEASLRNLAGKEVLLLVNKSPSTDGAREIVVRPSGFMQDAMLRYADWVRRNREYVAEKTGGTMGYIHIPDMGGRGLKEFTTWFYPQLDKEGMVVDARWNGGGFVSQLLINRLSRDLLWWDRARWGNVSTYPYRTLNGPFVVLTNEFAGSDGDIFPAAVQTAKLAPVIGKRSWGGVVGIRGGRQFVDKGVITQPEFAWFSPSKGWALENHGVDPDIVVENLPQDIARGADAQLDRAIQEVLALRAAHPPKKPVWGPAPDHSRKAFQPEG